jgi:hypothetical protein
MPAINLDHEPLSGRQEISDEATEQRHLPAKHRPKPAPAKPSPEQRLGRSERRAHLSRALVQERAARPKGDEHARPNRNATKQGAPKGTASPKSTPEAC